MEEATGQWKTQASIPPLGALKRYFAFLWDAHDLVLLYTQGGGTKLGSQARFPKAVSSVSG